jgi:hypothetical protein
VCFNELQVDLIVQRREKWRTASQNDWLDVQLVFVDQAKPDKGSG